jgi:mRNA deadenylase 3'-5' endonuclease subunit Ccr4
VACALAAALAGTVPSYASGTRPARYTDFTISSFNVLGSSHTLDSAKYTTGVERQAGVVKLLDRHHVDVVGFQELQADQLAEFLTRTNGTYAVYPGSSLRRIDGENSLAWRTDRWSLVSATTVAIPYFDGKTRQMPVVKLRNTQTRLTAWFANFHNPATNRRHPAQDQWRQQAIADEVALAKQLSATGRPVFFTGDMNEREKAFCPITGGAPMKAARGGTNRNGVCDAAHPWYVDWIFGSKKVAFSGYTEDHGALDRRTTDHPVIVSDVRVDRTRFN